MINIHTIVVLEPGKPPEVRKVNDLSLKSMQQIVEGYIQVLNCGKCILMVCNEEGLREKKLPNFRLERDIIVGTVLFCKEKGEEMTGLTDFQTKVVVELLNNVKRF